MESSLWVLILSYRKELRRARTRPQTMSLTLTSAFLCLGIIKVYRLRVKLIQALSSRSTQSRKIIAEKKYN
jgi:hypothetical protein